MEGSVGKSSTKVLMLICSVHLQGRGSQAGRGRHVDRGAYVHNKGQLASLARRRPSECHQRQGDTAPDRSCGNWRRLGILRTTARKKWSGVANNGQDIQDDEGWEAVYDTGTTRKFSRHVDCHSRSIGTGTINNLRYQDRATDQTRWSRLVWIILRRMPNI